MNHRWAKGLLEEMGIDVNVVYWARTNFARSSVLAALENVAGVQTVVCVALAQVLDQLAEADLLVLSDCSPGDARAILDVVNAPQSRLRAVHFLTAGRDGFASAGALREDILVSGPEGAIAKPVAEHALALALALNRQLLPAFQAQRSRRWDRSMAADAVSLEGRTALIVGTGPIGREIGVLARAFGMNPVGVTRTPMAHAEFDSVHGLDDLQRLIPDADLIVLCIALSVLTRHLMGAREFALCRDTAVIVNVGRGGLIDQAALEAALRGAKIRAAGLDVTDPEPLPDGHSLWSAPNLLITTHYSGIGSQRADALIGASAARAAERLGQ